jgi:hypothetical protein
MSYIRSTSNPESLYIWGDAFDLVNISYRVDPPLASTRQEMRVPRAAFEEACLKWKEWGEVHEIIEVDGFRVELVRILLCTGRAPPKNFNPLKDRREGAFLIRISYQRRFVHLWEVTWDHVVSNVEARTVPFPLPKKKTRTVSKKKRTLKPAAVDWHELASVCK